MPCSVCTVPIERPCAHADAAVKGFICPHCEAKRVGTLWVRIALKRNEQLACNPPHPPSAAPSEPPRKNPRHLDVEHNGFSGELLPAQSRHASHFSDPSSPPVAYTEAGAHPPSCDLISFRAPGEEQYKAMSMVVSDLVDWSASHVDGYLQQQH